MENNNSSEDRITEELFQRLFKDSGLKPGDKPNYDNILRAYYKDSSVLENIPKYVQQDDLRGLATIHNPKRDDRPVDNNKEAEIRKSRCQICDGFTTPMITRSREQEPYSCLNINRFGAVHPNGIRIINDFNESNDDYFYGIHLLLWMSNFHKKHEDISLEEYNESLRLLRDLELNLREISFNCKKEEGYFQAIKNSGKRAGGSLEHDHIQIMFTNLMPGTLSQDIDFLRKYHKPYSQKCLEIANKNPAEYLIGNINNVSIITPPSMKRNLEALIIPNIGIERLGEADNSLISDLAEAITFLNQKSNDYFKKRSQDPAHNIVLHSGKGIGRLYFHYMPVTQTIAGFEFAGLPVCSTDHKNSTQYYKTDLDEKLKKCG